MNLDEAHAAAIELEADDRFAVVAIGRFELVANLVTAHAGAYPWGLSVVSRIDPNYRAVCRTRDELDEFVLLAPQPTKAKPKPKTVARDNAATLPAPANNQGQALFAFE